MAHINNAVLEQILVCAFRYALGRATLVTLEARIWLETWWHILKPHTRKQIQDEIREAIEKGKAGEPMDVEAWKEILNFTV
jgi:hypothetical protein